MVKQYWLMKSEPDVFSIDTLKKEKASLWDGVRNYQARNFMWKEMKKGDLVLFYHSNTNPPGVAGLAEISTEAVPDPTAFDKKSKYYDEKSSQEKPRWYCVKVKFKKKFKSYISLEEIKAEKSLKNMALLNTHRLSVQPVRESEFKKICEMAGEA